MEYLKKDSAKANHFRTIFERTPSRSLTDCYCKPSHTKKQIWNAISLECAIKHGSSLKVLSYDNVPVHRSFCLSRPGDGSLSHSS